jgi:hypothetical protein
MMPAALGQLGSISLSTFVQTLKYQWLVRVQIPPSAPVYDKTVEKLIRL